MNKLICTIIVCLVTFSGFAQNELNQDQKKLRKNIFSAIKAAGYKDVTLESGDEDLTFTKDGVRYWVSVKHKKTAPYGVQLYTLSKYDTSGTTRKNVENCISLTNQNKAVKLVCDERYYGISAQILCEDADLFNRTFETLLEEIVKTQNNLTEILSSGLGGIDLTGKKSDVYDKVLELYDKGDYAKALKIFRYLADADYPLAYYMLGKAYREGTGVSKNEKLMVENYQKAIDSGETWCAYDLGEYFYDKGEYPKALGYFLTGCSNDNRKRSDSYYMVGKMYEEGKGASPNRIKAIENYKKSVEQSTKLESDARIALIRLGEQVENLSDFTDLPKSLLNGLNAVQMYQKGSEYESGTNNRGLSLPKAYGYYKAAADAKYIEAYLKMGEIYISKFYPFNDKKMSDKFYSKAFKELKKKDTDPKVAYQIGLMLMNGLGTKQNTEKALDYLNKASKNNIADADYKLGLFYQENNEYTDAFHFFLKAAENKCAGAMLEVAKAYETGKGIDQSSENAILWYTNCEKTGSKYSKEAAEALKRLIHADGDNEKE